MRNNLIVVCTILELICLQSILAYPAEEIVKIDGIPYQDHLWFSGYIPLENSKIHYILFDSQRDPDNDPVMLWLNGGPGCSSLIGMVYQNGPFVFKPNTTEFIRNQYAWNLNANMLYMQLPGGVGFSQSKIQSYDDKTTAEESVKALLGFFRKFPNLKKNQFYISGESYAGVYIPNLANQILNYNKLPSSKEFIINLKGIMVGNACTDPLECYYPRPGVSLFQYEFLYKHGYITAENYDRMRAVCVMDYRGIPCTQIRKGLDGDFSKTKTSIYSIYQPCYDQAQSSLKIGMSGGRYENLQGCDDSLGINYFFRTPGIWDKLHVDPIHFEQCSDKVSENYKKFQNASYWIYPILIKANLRVWVFSGDTDADVPITGTLHWIQRLRGEFGLPVQEPWREWWVPGIHKHEDQVGGMTWELKGLTFASVKGAGHMAPKQKRKQAYVLMNSFIKGNSLPFKSQ